MWDIRTITEDDAQLFRARMARGFGRDLPKDDEEGSERFRATFDYDRTLAAFEGDELVGTAAAFDLAVTVPGGVTVPMGGTTVITVQPTHRRRGLLRALMDRHLQDVADHAEPLAGLWASEGAIYQRFGFGPATYRYNLTLDAGDVTFLGEPTAGVVRLVEGDEVAKVVVDIYERFRADAPGALTRSDAWWSYRVLADIEAWRGGKSMMRYAIHEEGGVPTGYAMYRQKDHWENFESSGEVSVEEMITLTPEAHLGLWSFLTNIDLFPKVDHWNHPIDDPLDHMVTDHRRLRRMLIDGLWVRLMDVERALEARRYERDGSIVIEVGDRSRPETSGTYRLAVEAGSATCRRVSAPSQVAMSADVLGHLYLGGGNAMTMAAAGRIDGDPADVTLLHRLFSTAAAPWCPEVF